MSDIPAIGRPKTLTIEIHGDNVDKLARAVEGLGFTVGRAQAGEQRTVSVWNGEHAASVLRAVNQVLYRNGRERPA